MPSRMHWFRGCACVLAFAACLSLSGCEAEEAPTPEVADGTGGVEATTASYETPAQAVQTFVSAAVAKDVQTLRQAMAGNAEGEFQSLVEGTADESMLDELSQMFQGATVGEATVNGQEASVAVDLAGDRDESINLVQEEGGWKVVGF